MMRYVGLAVFACICFLGGYFTGQWTTFKAPAVITLLEAMAYKSAEFSQQMSSVELHTQSFKALSLIREVNDKNRAQIEAAFLAQIEQDINSLEEMMKDPAYGAISAIIQSNIKLLKSALGDKTPN